MTPLEGLLVRRIEAEGPITFADFMRVALYHPQHGYYAAGPERVGRGGDYLTSPELDPAFGALWARAFHGVWSECRRPERFELIEVGPGEGTFAAAVLDAVSGRFRQALHVRLVEPLATLRERQAHRVGGSGAVSWHDSVSELDVAGSGCVFFNEVLDNSPVHLVTTVSGKLRELYVGCGEGRLRIVDGPPGDRALTNYVERYGIAPGEGCVAEAGLEAERLVRDAAARVERGAVVIVDYGEETRALLERPGGTVVAYSASGADDLVLETPGARDITAHVNWTALAAALRAAGHRVSRPRPQREVLGALGLAGVDQGLKSAHGVAVASGRGAEAVRLLSRRQAVAALADPGGLGGLKVLMGLKGIEGPGFVGRADAHP